MKLVVYPLAIIGALTIASLVVFLILAWVDYRDQLRLRRLEQEAHERNAAELENWPVMKNEPY